MTEEMLLTALRKRQPSQHLDPGLLNLHNRKTTQFCFLGYSSGRPLFSAVLTD